MCCIEMLMGKRSFQIFCALISFVNCRRRCRSRRICFFFVVVGSTFFLNERLHKRKLLKPVSHRVYCIKISFKIWTKFSILCRLLNTCKMLMYETTQARAGKNRTQKDLKLIRMEKRKIRECEREKRWMRQIGTT